MGSSSKERLRNSLNRAPAVTAHTQIIPDLSTHANISNDDTTYSDSNTELNEALLASTQEELNRAQNELRELQSVQSRLEAEVATTTSEKVKLEKEVQDAEARFNGLKQELDRTQDALTQSNEAKTTLEKEVSALSAEKSQLTAKIADLNSQLSEAMDQLAQYRQSLQDVTDSVHILEAKLEETTTKNEALDSEVKELRKALEEAETKFAADMTHLVEEYGKSRVLKQFGRKKADTYKQTGFYQDNDIEPRLALYLQKCGYDKSTVINAAIDHLLNQLGY